MSTGAPKDERVVVMGTATEVGEQAFMQVCLPMIRAASKHAGQREVAAMYLGFLSSMFGAMAADFGQDQAAAMLQEATDVFGRWAPLERPAH